MRVLQRARHEMTRERSRSSQLVCFGILLCIGFLVAWRWPFSWPIG